MKEYINIFVILVKNYVILKLRLLKNGKSYSLGGLNGWILF